MSRGWTPLALPVWDQEDYYDKVSAQCDVLAAEWSRIQEASEKAEFFRLAELEDRYYDEPEVQEHDDFVRHLKNDLERAQLELIEDKLGELGARMMRPYEHHQEEEKLVEYLENRGW